MKSRKLGILGHRKAFRRQLDWFAERNAQATSKANHLQLEFPNWHESASRAEVLAMFKDDSSPSVEDVALAELSHFTEGLRTLGIGQANIAIALTQILNEYLIEGRTPRGLPPIRDWKDINTILRNIALAEASIELWGQAIGFDRIRELIEVSGGEE